MEFKSRGLVVDAESPFENDQLGREQEIKNLTVLLRNMNTPMVLSVNGRWGTGKSTFIKMWTNYLGNEGFSVQAFNAWTTDFSEDPLVAFLGEMNKGLHAQIAASGDTKAAWDQCKVTAGKIVRRALPVAVQLLTAGVLKADDLTEQIAADAMGSAIEDAVSSYERTMQQVEAFKDQFAEVVAKLQSASSKPLVIFVDELDRCRPTYAIELLERIKHLFDVPGVVFVLAMDREQLCHSIQAVYGGIDTAGYLRRFIDLEYSLPAPSKRKFIDHLGSVFELRELFEKRKRQGNRESDYDHLGLALGWLTDEFNIALREIEQLYSRLSIAVHATPLAERISAPLLVFLVVIRQCDQALYSSSTNAENFVQKSIEYLYSRRRRAIEHDYPIALIEGGVLASLPYNKVHSSPHMKSHYSVIESASSRSPGTADYPHAVVEEVNDLLGPSGRVVKLADLISRIELASEFNFPQADSV